MTDPPVNHLRDALLTLDGPNRRGLRNASRDRVNRDPQNGDSMTKVFYAVYCQCVDLDYEEGEVMRQLEGER